MTLAAFKAAISLVKVVISEVRVATSPCFVVLVFVAVVICPPHAVTSFKVAV